MGITIHYCGTMDDVGQVETMEDRLLDLAFSLGGRATIWRSFADHDASRVVRGLLVNLEPGQDTLSLLVSPEGHLVSLFQIDDAEKAPFDEPPYCFVKTQFGTLPGHIAIVHLLDALKQRFCSNLKVIDEGEYYEKRDAEQLMQKMQFLRSAITSVAEGLTKHGLTDEAAEDPNILVSRIERIVALVHKKLLSERRQSSNESFGEPQAIFGEPSLEEEVEAMDRIRRKSDLRSERMSRRIAEATASGLSADEAFELAMNEEGLPALPRDLAEPCDYTETEPWIESLPANPFDEGSEISRRREHPAVIQAHAFVHEVFDLTRKDSTQSSYFSVLTRASMEIVGGLVQATSDEMDDNTGRALAITQLKRALSGHAYARAAVIGLRSEKAITDEQSKQLSKQLKSLLTIIHDRSAAAWS